MPQVPPLGDVVVRYEEPPTGLKPAVLIANLGMTFAAKPKPFTALSGLDLSLYEGQVTALLGQNGAGKTTTISILTGMLLPSEGDATVYGHSVVSKSGIDAVRRLSGVCPQHDLTLDILTTRENLHLVGLIRGVDNPAPPPRHSPAVPFPSR